MTPSLSRDSRAAANRALMAGSADYFSWTETEQERFRAAPGREARARMEQVLLKQVLGIECAAAQAQDVWNDLSLEQLNRINPADLLTRGIGDDFVYLNESLADNQCLLDFDTLYDYDHDDFLFQEKWRHKDLKNYVSPGYFPLYQSRWIRFLVDEELVYGNLYSVAGYVMSRVEEAGDKRLNQRIPSSYVEGPNHGKEEGDGVVWDYRRDAGGLEPQLEELQRRWWQYQQGAELELQRKLAELPPQAYILHDQSPVPGETMVNLVIRNEAAMRQIRWKTLLADISACQGSRDEVDLIIGQETEKALKYIEDQYQAVIDHYVPPDITPGKERKLIMSNGALRDLQRLRSEEDEPD